MQQSAIRLCLKKTRTEKLYSVFVVQSICGSHMYVPGYIHTPLLGSSVQWWKITAVTAFLMNKATGAVWGAVSLSFNYPNWKPRAQRLHWFLLWETVIWVEIKFYIRKIKEVIHKWFPQVFREAWAATISLSCCWYRQQSKPPRGVWEFEPQGAGADLRFHGEIPRQRVEELFKEDWWEFPERQHIGGPGPGKKMRNLSFFWECFLEARTKDPQVGLVSRSQVLSD